jgi:hypothetical protein
MISPGRRLVTIKLSNVNETKSVTGVKSWVLGAVRVYVVPFTVAVGDHTTVSVPHSTSMMTLKEQVYGVGVARSKRPRLST